MTESFDEYLFFFGIITVGDSKCFITIRVLTNCLSLSYDERDIESKIEEC